MPNIQYVPVAVNGLISGAHLRDYKYDSGTRQFSVNKDLQIGGKLSLGTPVNVVYPPQYSPDGKWVQVMNKDGVTGFLRSDRLDMSKVVAANAVPLDKPFVFYSSENEKVVYESEKGIKQYTTQQVAKAKSEIAEEKKNAAAGKAFIDDYNKAKGTNISPEDLVFGKPGADKLKSSICSFIGSGKQADSKISAFMRPYNFQNTLKKLSDANIPTTYDMETGRIETAACKREFSQYYQTTPFATNKIGKDPDGLTPVDGFPTNYRMFRLDKQDRTTFDSAFRVYAEQAAAERLTYKQEMQDKEAHATFDVPSSLTNPSEQAQLQTDIANAATNPQALFAHQKEAHGGFLLAENHGNSDTRDWLASQIPNIKAAGINTLYLEHTFAGNDQRLIEEYLQSPADKEMSPALQEFCMKNTLVGMKDVLETAKQNGMRVVGLGSEFAQSDTGKDPYSRVLLFNQHAADQIQKDQTALPDGQKGFVVLAGSNHMCMHEGEATSVPIHGLSQLMGMQTLALNDQKQITAKDPDLIAELSTHTQVKISTFQAGLKHSGPTITNLQGLEKEEKSQQQPQKAPTTWKKATPTERTRTTQQKTQSTWKKATPSGRTQTTQQKTQSTWKKATPSGRTQTEKKSGGPSL